MDGNPARFPAAYKIFIVKTLCAFIAAGVMRGRVTGMIPGCRVFRTNYGKRGRGVAIAPGTGMPGSPAAPRRFETAFILPFSLPAAAALWRPCRDKGKAGGDRAAFREDGFYRARFHAVIGGAGKYPALFPRGRGDRLPGRKVETGTGLCHRYRGIAAAGTAVSSGFLPAPACPPFFPEVPGFGGDLPDGGKTLYRYSLPARILRLHGGFRGLARLIFMRRNAGLYKVFRGFIVSAIRSKKEFRMAAKFEIFLDRKKRYRFRLKAGNGEIIAASEAYESKAACIKGIKAIQKNAPVAAIIDPEETVKKAARTAAAGTGEKKPRGRKPGVE